MGIHTIGYRDKNRKAYIQLFAKSWSKYSD